MRERITYQYEQGAQELDGACMTDKEKQIADLLGSACMLLEIVVENQYNRTVGIELQYDDDSALMAAAHGYAQAARNLAIGAPAGVDEESRQIYDAVIAFVRMEDKIHALNAGVNSLATVQ